VEANSKWLQVVPSQRQVLDNNKVVADSNKPVREEDNSNLVKAAF